MANSRTQSRSKQGRRATGQTGPAADQGKTPASNTVASTVGQAVTSATSTVGKKADALTAAAGTGMKDLAESICENAPSDGVLGGASETVAGTLRQSGNYLERQGLDGLVEDCTAIIRNNPLPALFLGIGLGYVIGRVTRS